jgi:hypothetical protein
VSLQFNYPSINLGDKVFLNGEGNVTYENGNNHLMIKAVEMKGQMGQQIQMIMRRERAVGLEWLTNYRRFS